MKQHWRVHRSIAVVQTLISLRAAGNELRAAINQLITEGLPADAVLTEEPDTWEWQAADHWIVCVKDDEQKSLHVTEVAPVEEESDEV